MSGYLRITLPRLFRGNPRSIDLWFRGEPGATPLDRRVRLPLRRDGPAGSYAAS